ncbi:transposase, partial [Lactobacillus murinus]
MLLVLPGSVVVTVTLLKKLFPNAKIIIDRFHIVQMLNRAVNSTRTDLMNRFDNNSKNYKLFKRNWKLFLKRYDDLNCTYQFYERSQREWVTAEQLVNQGLQLADQDFRKAYWDYQRLLEVIDDPTPSKIKIFKQCLTEVNQKY